MRLGHGIIAADMQWVAADDPPQGKPAAFTDTIFPNSLDGVLRTGGVIYARIREQRRDDPLIKANGRDSSRAHEGPQRHDYRSSTPARLINERSACVISCGDDSLVLGVANKMTSRPVTGKSQDRAASLRTRLERLRTTAHPSLLAATKATLPGSPSFADSVITILISGWLYRRPSWNTCSKSCRDLIVLMRDAYSY